jgi:hypothetical protein
MPRGSHFTPYPSRDAAHFCARLRGDPGGSRQHAPARSFWPKPGSSTADGRPRTGTARELQARFPKVKVEEDRIFIIDGPVWTSAGMTAGIDLALAMIEQDLGADVARAVARKLVVAGRHNGAEAAGVNGTPSRCGTGRKL